MENITIVALSSGQLPSGVAVIRVSGPSTRLILEALTGCVPQARRAGLYPIQSENQIIDTGIVLFFEAPKSFTGEDCAEFQIHGGQAVVSALLDTLCSYENVRLAEAGEFSRRAFENGRMDLTEIDGIADLVASETEMQRKLALSQTQGALREKYDTWRARLIHIRAMIEAELDFSDEEDVPTDISAEGLRELMVLQNEINAHLQDASKGEIIRDGFRIAIMGKPNAGKSSLLNYLAKRDVAIVTAEAGTTRDVIDVHLDINGFKVTVSDTAGIRETENVVEAVGISRAHALADASNLVLWLVPVDGPSSVTYHGSTPVLTVVSKDDGGEFEHGISTKTGRGIDWLLGEVSERLSNAVNSEEVGLITRKRYADCLERVAGHVSKVLNDGSIDIDLKAEELRLAGDEIGRITGKVDVEDLLDVIFAEFCVGK